MKQNYSLKLVDSTYFGRTPLVVFVVDGMFSFDISSLLSLLLLLLLLMKCFHSTFHLYFEGNYLRDTGQGIGAAAPLQPQKQVKSPPHPGSSVGAKKGFGLPPSFALKNKLIESQAADTAKPR